jgi:hypothetical protein
MFLSGAGSRVEKDCIYIYRGVKVDSVGGGGQETQGTPPSGAGAMGVYDPNFNYGGTQPWYQTPQFGHAIGQGFQQVGQSLTQESKQNFITQQAGITPQNQTYQSTPAGLIPTSYGTDVMSVLQRLLQGYQ